MKVSAAEGAVITAAIQWWVGKCPLSYSERQHHRNPTVNTVSGSEVTLALAVRDYCATVKRRG